MVGVDKMPWSDQDPKVDDPLQILYTRELPGVALRPSHVVFPKIGISRKNWDFRQNIWISGARAPRAPEVPIKAS